MQVFQADEVTVTCLIDGAFAFADADFPEIDSATKAARLAAAGLTAVQTDFNAYLLAHPGGIDLVDTGCGGHFGPQGGLLPERLAALGIKADQIDRVILTHLHTDHAGGLLVDGRLQYPRAEVIVHANEIAYWQGRDAVRDEILHACAPNLKTVTDGENLGHGIRAWALPGHTPGHMGLRIGDALALIGDVIHSEALQFPEPETRNANDVTRADAEATRRTCLDTIVDNDLVWTGSHMLGPDKFARLARQGAGYVRVTR